MANRFKQKQTKITFIEAMISLQGKKRLSYVTNELQYSVVVDIVESNLRCLVNYKCIHECTLNNLIGRFLKIYTC